VPFFLHGGTALASGRGEQIEALPDLPEQHLLVAWPRPRVQDDKTARMYAALRPEHFTGGSCSQRLAERIRRGEPVREEDVCNVFESVLGDVASDAARIFGPAAARGNGQPHLCGSGPAVFFLRTQADTSELPELRDFDVAAMTLPHTITAAEAVAMRETP
jgi:4-diphosphocytidyl-2-C-methyl-D-erythritol kinase